MKQSLICQLCCVLIFGLWVASSPPDSAGQGRDAKLGEEQGDVTNIFLPAPRGLRQQLTRAQKALREEQYSEAVDLLGQLLAAPEIGDDSLNGVGEQDYFLGGTTRSGTEVSLKTEAQRLLGAMPDQGRELYELKFGADARQLLDSALETRDIQKLVEVTRRYFHTDAGYEAMMLIGRHYLDQGRPLAAALRLQRLEESTSATERYDPELSVLLATCWLLADMPDRARDTLAGLKSRAPDARLRVGDKTVSLFDLADKTLAESMLVEGGRSRGNDGADRSGDYLAAADHWPGVRSGPQGSDAVGHVSGRRDPQRRKRRGHSFTEFAVARANRESPDGRGTDPPGEKAISGAERGGHPDHQSTGGGGCHHHADSPPRDGRGFPNGQTYLGVPVVRSARRRGPAARSHSTSATGLGPARRRAEPADVGRLALRSDEQ